MTQPKMARGALVVALGLLNVVLLGSWIYPWTFRQTLVSGSIFHDSGFSYIAKRPVPRWRKFLISVPGDGPGTSNDSKLQLFEDGKELGPSHSQHSAIRERGGGRYSHWQGSLFFSASDNSNPTETGRLYEVRYPARADGWVTILSVILLLIAALGLRRSVRRVLLPLVFFDLGVATFVLPVEMILRSEYSKLHWLGAYGEPLTHLQPTHNSKGYRDGEHESGKVQDRLRILILGDSMTYGSGLADEQIYPRLLSARLGPKVEVIVLARNGWNTPDQLDALKREGIGYVPDIAVVAVVTNDPGPMSTEPSGQQPEWVIFRRLPLNLDFFRFLDYMINRFGELHGWRYTYGDWERDLFDPNMRYFRPWQMTVRELASILKNKGIDSYAFTMISPVTPSAPETIRKYDILARTFADAGFVTVNLHENFVREFGPSGGRHLWATPNDAHPGPAINQFFAREMAQVLGPRVQALLAKRGLRP